MKSLFLSLLLLLLTLHAISQEISSFRGSGRMGIFNETGLLKTWPTNGPELLLKADCCGKGYSSPVFYDNKVFITGVKHDTIDVCTAFDMNGNLLWEKPYGRAWFRSYPDTRSTPTIENGIIYLASGSGEIVAMDSDKGKILWSVNAHEMYQGVYLQWGIAESVLLTKDAVVYTTGGDFTSVVALKKTDGSLLWKTKSFGGERSYASSVLININGRNLILSQIAKSLLCIDPENGNVVWDYDLIQHHLQRSGKGNNSNTPIYSDGKIFVTSGYNHPGIMFSLADDGNSVEVVWKNDTLDTHHGGTVLVDGNIYGSNWLSNTNGNWVSLNWESGKVNWETEWINKGSIITADGMLYLFEEKSGTVALVEPSYEELKIKGAFKFDGGSGPFWAHPYIADGKLFLRHGDVLHVYNIKG